MRTMTPQEWNAIPRDYKTTIDGVRHVLVLDAATGYTMSEPVSVQWAAAAAGAEGAR